MEECYAFWQEKRFGCYYMSQHTCMYSNKENQMSEKKMIEVTLKAKLPELNDFEYTGELRSAHGEWYFNIQAPSSRSVQFRDEQERTIGMYPILRKKFRCEEGKWYVTRDGKQIRKYDPAVWRANGESSVFAGSHFDLVREATADDLK